MHVSLSVFDRNANKARACGVIAVVAGGLLAFESQAQQQGEPGADRRFTVTPSVTLTETYSDNVNLSSVDKRSDFTTQISPGVHIASNYGRLKGFFDYSLTQVLYANNTKQNELQNSLNASGNYEAVDNWAYLDFSGNISQQSISAFGTPSADNTSINSNRTETATYRISPYLKGHLSTLADYEARYNYETSKSKSSLASDIDRKEAILRLNGDISFTQLRWSADLNKQDINYSIGRKTLSDRVRLNLTYKVNPQLDTTLIGGWESNNYQSVEKEAHTSSGLGVNWRPSDTTRFSAEGERRYFGNTHSFAFEHRTPRTAWSYSNNKSVSTSNNPNTLVSLGGLYDLLFNQFATLEPDPIKRAQLVSSFLQANGLSPNTNVAGSFASSSLLLQQTQMLTFAVMGIRDTITFSLNRGNSQSLSTIGQASDDFANTSFVATTGVTSSFSHRLTPDASINLLLSQQRTAGQSSVIGTKIRTMNINFSTRLAEKVYTNLGLRHVVSDGASTPYKETAVTGSVNLQF